MPKTFTRSVPDLSDTTVPDETQFYTRVYDAASVVRMAEEYASFAADQAAWRAARPGQPDPLQVVVADPGNVKMAEKVFVKWYFRAEDSSRPGEFVDEVDEWVQIMPILSGTARTAFLSAALALHNARRAALNLDPAV